VYYDSRQFRTVQFIADYLRVGDLGEWPIRSDHDLTDERIAWRKELPCSGSRSDYGVSGNLNVVDRRALIVRRNNNSTTIAVVDYQIVAHHDVLGAMCGAREGAGCAGISRPIVSDTYASICNVVTDHIMSYGRITCSDKFEPLILSYAGGGSDAGRRAGMARYTVSGHDAVLNGDV